MPFHALRLTLGEVAVTLADPDTGAMSYGWLCGCRATTEDGVSCTISTCEGHESLLPPEAIIAENGPARGF